MQIDLAAFGASSGGDPDSGTVYTGPASPAVSNAARYNYYMARMWVVTALRAARMGLRPSRKYGYYVVMTPAESCRNSRNNISINAWCKTKGIALKHVSDNDHAKREGYCECPRGCMVQARRCKHGIPEMVMSMPSIGS